MPDRLIDTRQIAKKIARLVVGYGSNVIVRGVIRSNVQIDNAIPRLAASVAAYAISDVVSRHAKDEIDDRVDRTFDLLMQFVPKDSVWAKVLAANPVEDDFPDPEAYDPDDHSGDV